MSQDWASSLERLASRIEDLSKGGGVDENRGSQRRGRARGSGIDAFPASLNPSRSTFRWTTSISTSRRSG